MRFRLLHRNVPALPAPRRRAVALLAPASTQPEADVDLDRLVWDPEYRAEVRDVLRATA